jgi:hypothetical protein
VLKVGGLLVIVTPDSSHQGKNLDQVTIASGNQCKMITIFVIMPIFFQKWQQAYDPQFKETNLFRRKYSINLKIKTRENVRWGY